MTIGFKVKYNWYQIGEPDLFYAFFSTVAFHLENKNWGSRFFTVMNEFYQGKLSYDQIKPTYNELLIIKEELKKYPPEKVIWDFDDLSKKAPCGNNISEDIKDLSDYFVTSDGENLFDLIFRALYKAEQLHCEISVGTI